MSDEPEKKRRRRAEGAKTPSDAEVESERKVDDAFHEVAKSMGDALGVPVLGVHVARLTPPSAPPPDLERMKLIAACRLRMTERATIALGFLQAAANHRISSSEDFEDVDYARDRAERDAAYAYAYADAFLERGRRDLLATAKRMNLREDELSDIFRVPFTTPEDPR